jgi:hypothetical protein
MSVERQKGLLGQLAGGVFLGVKLVLSLGMAITMLAGAVFIPQIFEDAESKAARPALAQVFSEPIYKIEASPDQTAMLVRTRQSVLVRDLGTGEILQTLPPQDGYPSVAGWVPASHQVLVGFTDGSLMVWDPDHFTIESFPKPPHHDVMRAICITSDGTVAVTGSSHRICVWNVSSRTLLAQSPLSEKLTQVALSQDDTQILLGFGDGSITVLRLDDLRPVKQYQTELPSVRDLKSFDGGSQILVGSPDGTCLAMDAETGDVLKRFEAVRVELLDLEISPDQQFAVMSDCRNGIHVYSVETWTEVGTLSGHAKPVSSLKFAGTEPVLYSGSYDGTIRSWDLETLSELGGFHGSLPLAEEE